MSAHNQRRKITRRAMHISCSICAETICPSDELSVTRCGHMFHTGCMATWLGRVKNCPQCRNRCTTETMVRLYLNVSLNDTINEPDQNAMQSSIDSLQINLRETKVNLKKRETELDISKESQKMARRTIVGLETQLEQKEMLLKSNLEVQKTLKMQNLLIPGLEKRLKEAQAELATLESVQNVLQSSAAEVDTMLKNEHSTRSLCTMVVLMKREVRSQKEKDVNLRKALVCVQSDLQKSRSRETYLKEKIALLESDLSKLQEDAHRQDERINPSRLFSAELTSAPSISSTKSNETEKQSNSPYLKVVASNLLKNREQSIRVAPLNSHPIAQCRKSPTSVHKLSIFKKPRLADPSTSIANANIVSNGVGGSERRDLFDNYARKKAAPIARWKPSTPS